MRRATVLATVILVALATYTTFAATEAFAQNKQGPSSGQGQVNAAANVDLGWKFGADPHYTVIRDETLQSVIDHARAGDIIRLPKRTYYENVAVSKSLTLIGAGRDKTVVDGDSDRDGVGNSRVFIIGPGIEVTLTDMTIRNGNAQGSYVDYGGGGVLNRGMLTVINCDIHDNTAVNRGGGISNWAGSSSAKANLQVYASSIHDNTAVGGAGIFNIADFGRATVTVWNSGINSNVCGADAGGGIQNWANNGIATVTVIKSNIRNNIAAAAHGGGLYNNAYYGSAVATLNVKSSNIQDNEAETDGGGIWNSGSAGTATVNVWNSDISYNKVTREGPGGGIFSSSAGSKVTLNVIDSNIHHNTASGGGGIYVGADQGGASTARVQSSAVYSNKAIVGGGIYMNAVWGTAIASVRSSAIYSNAADFGGSISNEAAAQSVAKLIISNSHINTNIATKDGGGIWNQGTLVVTSCTLRNNVADADHSDTYTGHGGGIFYTVGYTPILMGMNKIQLNVPDNIYPPM